MDKVEIVNLHTAVCAGLLSAAEARAQIAEACRRATQMELEQAGIRAYLEATAIPKTFVWASTAYRSNGSCTRAHKRKLLRAVGKAV